CPSAVARVAHPLSLPHCFADDPRAWHVSVDVAPELDLPVRPTLIAGLAAEPADLLVGVAEPPRRRRIRGEAVASHLGLALAFGRLEALEDREGIIRRDRVGDVAEVDAADEIGRAHV